MRARLAVLLLVPLLAACDGATPGADGPLKLGIVSGNRQTAVAGDKQLGQPVVGKLVRTPGGIAFNLVTPAYAEGTVVSGSPVAGAVVCAVAVSDAALQAFVPCTNTGSDGTATFFFSPGTKAGEAKSEIRGTVEGRPAVFDTVVATVQAGPPALINADFRPTKARKWHLGDTLDVRPYLIDGSDAHKNVIPIDSLLARHPISWAYYASGVNDVFALPPSGTGPLVPIPTDWCTRPNTHGDIACFIGVAVKVGGAPAGGFTLDIDDWK